MNIVQAEFPQRHLSFTLICSDGPRSSYLSSLPVKSGVCVLGLHPPLCPKLLSEDPSAAEMAVPEFITLLLLLPETRCKISIMNQRWAVQSCLIPVFCHNLCFFQTSIVILWPQTLIWKSRAFYSERNGNNLRVISLFSWKVGAWAEEPWTAEQGGVICFHWDELWAPVLLLLCSQSWNHCWHLHFWVRHRTGGCKSRDRQCTIRAREGCKVNIEPGGNSLGFVTGAWGRDHKLQSPVVFWMRLWRFWSCCFQ